MTPISSLSPTVVREGSISVYKSPLYANEEGI